MGEDYVDKAVRQMTAGYIAIVRHSNQRPDAVKVWKFNDTSSLLQKFVDSKRTTVTTGGHIQAKLLPTAPMPADDPIFSVNGNLIFNYEFANNGVRIVLSESYLSKLDADDDNTYGLGNDLFKTPYTDSNCRTEDNGCIYEVGPIQDCPYNPIALSQSCGSKKVLGSDATGNILWCRFSKAEDYGSYAIYVLNASANFRLFPNLNDIPIIGVNIPARTFF